MKPIYVGCSGWNYQSWRGGLYPAEAGPSHWLERYAEKFDTVEVNATFYRLVSAKAVERWVRQTPPDFRFAVKASRYLTHVKRLAGIGEGIARFYEGLEPMVRAGRLTAVLWQLPEIFHRDDGRLAQALELLPEGRHAFEFRHPSWFAKDVYALLRQHDVALVVGDHPERPFQSDVATAGWRYVRFHHGHGRRGNYSERELRAWAERLVAWRRRRETLVYFNNDWEGFAPRNAARLSALLAHDGPTRDRRASRAKALDELRGRAADCRDCPLWRDATQTVFGEGSPGATIMLVGEQPGDREDLQGQPFVGPAGALLDRALTEAGIDRSKTYTTNAVKHFKYRMKGRRRIHQRPDASEVAACRQWLDGEIELVRPRVLVCMGATAASAVLGGRPSVERERGRPLQSDLAPTVMITAHPSAALRQRGSQARHAAVAALVADLEVAAKAAKD